MFIFNSILLRSHIDEGDEVIVIEPSFDSYEPVIKICGGIVRYIPLRLVAINFFFII